MGASITKLNNRQWDVLRWVADGCPERVWPDSTYKTTAVALQSRRLVLISRSGGVWSVAVTDKGRTLVNGDAGSNESPNPARAASERPTLKKEYGDKTAPQRQRPVRTTPVDGTEGPVSLSPTRALLRDIVEADGELVRNVKDDKTNYQSLVSIINRRNMAPDGMRVVIEQGDNYAQRIFRLEPQPAWTTTPVREVVAAERIGRWHKVVAELRDEKSIGMTSDVARRALRILQSLAAEAEARGHSIERPRVHTDNRGFTHQEEKGQLVIDVRGHRFAVWLIQREDHSPHEPTAKELKDREKYSWSFIPRWDKEPGRRLQLRLYKPVHRGWHDDWNDTKTLSVRVEDHLPEVMHQIERTADANDARAKAEREELVRRQDRQARAELLVGDRHAEIVRERVLLDQAQQWAQVRQVRAYIDKLGRHVDGLASTDQRTEAERWLRWCTDYLERSDPFRTAARMPIVPRPTWEERSKLVNEILASDLQ